jgi:hypothetical protein
MLAPSHRLADVFIHAIRAMQFLDIVFRRRPLLLHRSNGVVNAIRVLLSLLKISDNTSRSLWGERLASRPQTLRVSLRPITKTQGPAYI